ncbi:MAG: hypothetical protein IBJ19_10740, partial [Gemmatimonadaceae bacterium]|nr:hypothetical protein [Gemmatimonadaceae bacterium]
VGGSGGEAWEWRGELAGPESGGQLTRARFLATLHGQDAAWAARQAAAERQGKVLRYVLRATSRAVRVGLQAVDRSHPLASLRGTDNQIVFTTRRYREYPLVITGPGAGPEVTAAGVLNDILQLTPA